MEILTKEDFEKSNKFVRNMSRNVWYDDKERLCELLDSSPPLGKLIKFYQDILDDYPTAYLDGDSIMYTRDETKEEYKSRLSFEYEGYIRNLKSVMANEELNRQFRHKK